MGFWKTLAKRGAYHITHPLLRIIKTASRSVSARAVVVRNGEVLLVRHIGVKRWSLPGGALKIFEPPVIGLRRELAKELGMLMGARDYKYKLGVYTHKTEKRRETVHVFVIEADSFYFKKQWELDEVQWFYLTDLPKDLSPATRRRLDEFKRGEKNVSAEW